MMVDKVKVRGARRWTLWAGGVFGLLLVGYFVLSSVILTTALKPVRQPYEGSPADLGLSAERIEFQSAAEPLTLRGFLVTGRGPRAIVLVHGLDSACWRGFHRGLTAAYHEAGYTVLAYDQRGHGQSDDALLGLSYLERSDVKAAVGLLEGRGFKAASIGLHGSSYGAATVLNAAAYLPEIPAVIADSPFADFQELLTAELKRRVGIGALFQFGILQAVRFQYGLDPEVIAPLVAVSKISPRPILFMHGGADTRIPVSHTRRLYEAANNPENELWILPGAGHTKAFSLAREEYLRRVFAFWDRTLEGQSGG